MTNASILKYGTQTERGKAVKKGPGTRTNEKYDVETEISVNTLIKLKVSKV